MMDNELIKILNYLNLSEKEARLYLASLQIGKGTVYEIAKIANLKRPTAYVLVEGLIQKGLITTQEENKKTLCSPVPPKRLIETWKGKVEALESIYPELNAYYQKSAAKPKVSIYEGEKGADIIYSELTPKNTKGEEILLFGSIAILKEKFNYRFKIWDKVARNKNNKIRELLTDDSETRKYIERVKPFNNPNHQIRVVPKNIFGECDNIIYQNKIAIFSLKEEVFVTVIESEETVKTYKAIFEMAWESAKEPVIPSEPR